MLQRRYAIRPEVRLTVRGCRAALRHFEAEYGAKATDGAGGEAEVEVVFGEAAPGPAATRPLAGGHKSVRWQVGVSDPGEVPLRATIELAGRPLSFVLSLVQGYFVEPLLSLATAARGYVLVPAAALVGEDGAVLLMGRSGSGKSSLSARALAAGQTVLGDDQVLLDRAGTLYAYPRRMRFYSDLARTAPSAYRRLGRTARAGLVARGAVRALSRGYVAPPIRLSPRELGPPPAAEAVPLSRVAVVERVADAGAVRATEVESEEAVRLAHELLDAQRAHIGRLDEAGWPAALADARAAEDEMLGSALADVSIERLSVPSAWDSRTAIDGLAARLGIRG